MEKIKIKSETLSKLLQEIGTVAYQQAAKQRSQQKDTQAGKTSEPKSENEKGKDQAEKEKVKQSSTFTSLIKYQKGQGEKRHHIHLPIMTGMN